LREFRGEKGAITRFALSPDGKQLAFAEHEGAIFHVRLDGARDSQPRILAAAGQDWKALAFDRESLRLAAFGADGRLFFWNVQTGKNEPVIELVAAEKAVFSHDLRWVATVASGETTLHALTPPSDLLAKARERAKGELDFADITSAYGDLTESFRRGISAAREKRDVSEAAGHFHAALAMFREIDPALRFDPDVEARRLTAEGFFAYAEKQANEGAYASASEAYANAQKLNPTLNPQEPEHLRRQALQGRLRRADVFETNGELDSALKELAQALTIDAQAAAAPEKRLREKVADMRVSEARRMLDSGDSQAATALFEEAAKLNPALAASLDFQRESQKSRARELMRSASTNVKESRFVEAIRDFAAAQKSGGVADIIEFPDSRALARANYEATTGVLEVTFRSGEVYRYTGVRPAVHEALARAPSKGGYFADEIRGKYPFEHAKREPPGPPSVAGSVPVGGFGGELLKAIDKAIEAAPANSALHYAKGVARAFTGDLRGAADSLEVFVAGAARATPEVVRQSMEWAGQLREGINPFTPEVLEKLPAP
jgi:tetratricopeptide (TPR) repeat protein